MRLINFFTQQVQKWNDENKCGKCFKFYAPLTEQALNIQQIDDCCVNVMLTRDRVQSFGVNNTYSTTTGTLSDQWVFKNFTLLFLVPQPIGVNNYTEILGHSTELSKYNILEDLEECIIDMNLNFCEVSGNEWQVTQWNATQLINFQDNNYTGYRINVSIRRRKIN